VFSRKDAKKFKSDCIIRTVTVQAIIHYGSTFYSAIPSKDHIRAN